MTLEQALKGGVPEEPKPKLANKFSALQANLNAALARGPVAFKKNGDSDSSDMSADEEKDGKDEDNDCGMTKEEEEHRRKL
jgi:hypothetical protein